MKAAATMTVRSSVLAAAAAGGVCFKASNNSPFRSCDTTVCHTDNRERPAPPSHWPLPLAGRHAHVSLVLLRHLQAAWLASCAPLLLKPAACCSTLAAAAAANEFGSFQECCTTVWNYTAEGSRPLIGGALRWPCLGQGSAGPAWASHEAYPPRRTSVQPIETPTSLCLVGASLAEALTCASSPIPGCQRPAAGNGLSDIRCYPAPGVFLAPCWIPDHNGGRTCVQTDSQREQSRSGLRDLAALVLALALACCPYLPCPAAAPTA
jgi:hypothetical protein